MAGGYVWLVPTGLARPLLGAWGSCTALFAMHLHEARRSPPHWWHHFACQCAQLSPVFVDNRPCQPPGGAYVAGGSGSRPIGRKCTPVGSATRSNRRCALPPRSAPPGGSEGRHRLRPCHGFLSPPYPRTGALPIAALLNVSGFAAPAWSLRWHRPAALGFLRRLGRPLAPEIGAARPVPIPLLSFLSSCNTAQCNAEGLLRQGKPWLDQQDAEGTCPF